jgi:hypothetical protein
MIARFRVLLPFNFTIPFDAKFIPYSFGYGEYEAILYPPTQANIETSASNITSQIPFADAGANLDAAFLATPTEAIKVNGKETIQANLLQIDFVANRDFNRSAGQHEIDPPVESFLEVANHFVEKFRSLGSFPNIKKLTPETVVAWRIEYLTDEGTELERDEGLSRSVHSIKNHWQANVLTAGLWKESTDSFLDFKPYVWDSLLLDAFTQSASDANAAIVLANAALEAAVDFALDVSARNSKISYQSYEWLANKRDFTKQPSAKEKFDEMLYLIAGRSLKTENQDLWKAFLELRDARNSMVHEGNAKIKKGKSKILVDASIAIELLKKAAQIINWLEALLPINLQRQKYRKDEYNLSFSIPARGDGKDGKDVYLVGVKSSHPMSFSFTNKK